MADALSPSPTELSQEEVVKVSNVTFSPLKPDCLDRIRSVIRQDDMLVKLGEVIQKGWPEEISFPPCVLPYFSYKVELSMQDRVIYKGKQIVIPTSVRQEIKEKVHAGHLGINACLRRSHNLVRILAGNVC